MVHRFVGRLVAGWAAQDFLSERFHSTDIAGQARNVLRGVAAAGARFPAPVLPGSRHAANVVPLQKLCHRLRGRLLVRLGSGYPLGNAVYHLSLGWPMILGE